MLDTTEETCAKCNAAMDPSTVIRCPICFKRVCDRCARNKGGKEFCSQYCAEYFFHYEDED